MLKEFDRKYNQGGKSFSRNIAQIMDNYIELSDKTKFNKEEFENKNLTVLNSSTSNSPEDDDYSKNIPVRNKISNLTECEEKVKQLRKKNKIYRKTIKIGAVITGIVILLCFAMFVYKFFQQRKIISEQISPENNFVQNISENSLNPPEII